LIHEDKDSTESKINPHAIAKLYSEDKKATAERARD